MSVTSLTVTLVGVTETPFSSTQRYFHEEAETPSLLTLPLMVATAVFPHTILDLSTDKSIDIFPSLIIVDAGVASVVSSTTGASAVSSEKASAAGASVATVASVPSLNSAAHTGTLEVASIATTSDILNVFFAMPFFVFLIFVMIIVPLWVVDRLILWKKIVLSRAI